MIRRVYIIRLDNKDYYVTDLLHETEYYLDWLTSDPKVKHIDTEIRSMSTIYNFRLVRN